MSAIHPAIIDQYGYVTVNTIRVTFFRERDKHLWTKEIYSGLWRSIKRHIDQTMDCEMRRL